MASQWDMSASLVIDPCRFPIHGRLAACIDRWRKEPEDVRGGATLLLPLPMAPCEGSEPRFSFRGDELRQLAAALDKRRNGEQREQRHPPVD